MFYFSNDWVTADTVYEGIKKMHSKIVIYSNKTVIAHCQNRLSNFEIRCVQYYIIQCWPFPESFIK